MVGISTKVATSVGALASALVLGACGGQVAEAPSVSSSIAASSAEAHNDADVAFAQSMIPHHEQAIEMSDVILAKQGIDARVTELATGIKAAQAPEIDQLRGWLDQWGTPEHDMADMSGGGMSMDGHGMMSEQDMVALADAQGAEASRLFLTQMIEHHQGAITMAQQEIDNGQFLAAVQMAQTIESTQQTEITTMQGVLDSL